ncbi:MAG: alpha/beta hydrolase [Acidobacteriota bacterium]
MKATASLLLALVLFVAPAVAVDDDFMSRVSFGHADSNGVKIHYATMGEGPLVVMIHGFPDYWYSWRDQMETLASDFQVVAIDQRGYNKSDAPDGQSNYGMRYLVGDVAAVIKSLGRDKATVVGHDWGGAVAWQVALNLPDMVENLIILNLPHPNGIGRELANNPEQQKNSDYARKFQEGSASDPDIFFGMPMNAMTLSGWVTDADARKLYQEAFGRSDFDAMLAYYKENYGGIGGDAVELPKVKMPVLQFHGLEDTALHSDGLNNTWDWLEKDLTLVTVPGAGHFVQQDASEMVSTTMLWWLKARSK